MVYLQLFVEFFKTGLLAVGGGLATLPFLKEIAQTYSWFSVSQLTDMIAISESTPGPIGINLATYVGYTTGSTQIGGVLGGVLGSVVATLGLVFPSIVVILIIAMLLKSFRNNRHVEAAFYGLRPASAALIAAALVSLLQIALLHVDLFRASGKLPDLVDLKSLILAAVLLVLTRWVKPTKKLHPILFILFSAVVGAVFSFGGA